MRYTLFIALLLISLCIQAQNVLDVSHVSLTVSDLQESIKFFELNTDAELESTKTISGGGLQDLFGLKSPGLTLEVATMHIGKEEIRLLHFNKKGEEIPLDSRSNDLWFQHMAIAVRNMESAYANVFEHKVKHVSTSPQTLPDYIPAAAGISAFYFRDADEHNVELIYFPPGKGNPKWRATTTEEEYLGIDHTAIAVSDSEASLEFYRDLLGLKVAGHSENYGSEQEHLNQVFGARLAITGLQAPAGIGVEFLEYIAPPGGRIYPANSTPLDHWHWHISMQVDDLDKMLAKIDQTNIVVSSKLAKLPELGYEKAIILRDPDHHAILLYESKTN